MLICQSKLTRQIAQRSAKDGRANVTSSCHVAVGVSRCLEVRAAATITVLDLLVYEGRDAETTFDSTVLTDDPGPVSTRLQTARLVIRPLARSDAEAWISMVSDPEVRRFLPPGPDPTMETFESGGRVTARDGA
jgi:hypothetical protein